MSFQKVIAIDGPSGSGKSTMARQLAQRLGLLFIDTGSMYRSLALWADKLGVAFKEGPAMDDFLRNLQLEYGKSEDCLVAIDGHNITQAIREHKVSTLASQISQLPSVRNFLVEYQRRLAKDHICVMEGRDIGTVVFPRAFCKFFITASVEVRAQRRQQQLQEMGKGIVALEQVRADVEKRDHADIHREVAPLAQAEDAILIDTSLMQPEEVLESLIDYARTRAKQCGLSL